MVRYCSVLMMVVCVAIWPFANSSKAQDGEGQSPRAMSDRIDSLERKIERLEDKIRRLENSSDNTLVGADGAQPEQAGRVNEKKPCPGEWRQIGGGWACYDPNAK